MRCLRPALGLLVLLPVLSFVEPLQAKNIAHGTSTNIYQHGVVYSAKWAQDGKLFVECTSVGLLLYGGDNVQQPPQRLNGHPRCTRFDINSDGTIFAWSTNELRNLNESEDETVIYVVNTKTGFIGYFSMTDLTCNCSGKVAGVKLSNDGALLAAIDEMGIVKIWNIASEQTIVSIRVTDIPKTPIPTSDQTLELKQVSSAIELRDKQTGKMRHKFDGLDWTVTAFSPDGRLLVTLDHGNLTIFLNNNYYAEIYYASNGIKRANLVEKGKIRSLAFSPDSKTIATGQNNGSIVLFDALHQQQKTTFTGSDSPVISVAYRPDGLVLASVSDDQIVRFWDTKTHQLLYTHEYKN